MSENNKSINQSVVKAFELLQAFSSDKKEWGVRELALKTGYNKSTTYRLLNTLTSLNVVHQNRADKYVLGAKLFELGNRVPIYKTLRRLTHDIIQEVALEIQETVLLSVLRSQQVFHIDKADSQYGLKINTVVGSYEALHATAPGKLLLAFSNSRVQNQILNHVSLTRFSKNTICEVGELRNELEKIKKQGYALDIEESESGLVCIAIPVRNGAGKTVASLSAWGPLSRFKMEKISDYITVLSRGLDAIEMGLKDFEEL